MAVVLPHRQAQPADQLPVLDTVHVQRLPVVLRTGRRSRLTVHLIFLDDSPQRHVGGQSIYTRRGQLHHTATVGAFQRQAERTPDGVVGRHLEEIVQAGLAEGV